MRDAWRGLILTMLVGCSRGPAKAASPAAKTFAAGDTTVRPLYEEPGLHIGLIPQLSGPSFISTFATAAIEWRYDSTQKASAKTGFTTHDRRVDKYELECPSAEYRSRGSLYFRGLTLVDWDDFQDGGRDAGGNPAWNHADSTTILYAALKASCDTLFPAQRRVSARR